MEKQEAPKQKAPLYPVATVRTADISDTPPHDLIQSFGRLFARDASGRWCIVEDA